MFTVTIDGKIVPATNVRIIKTLNDVTSASFQIPNTDENRELITSDKIVEISFESTLLFKGLLSNPNVSDDVITCTARDYIASKLSRKLYERSGSYEVSWENERYDVILSDICDCAGVEYGPGKPYVPPTVLTLGESALGEAPIDPITGELGVGALGEVGLGITLYASSKTLSSTFVLIRKASTDLTSTFATFKASSKALSCKFSIQVSEGSNDLRSKCIIVNKDSKSLSSKFIPGGVAHAQLSSRLGIPITSESNLHSTFYLATLHSTAKDVPSTFEVLQGFGDLSSKFSVGRVVSVRFNHSTCLQAVETVCDLVGVDWWTADDKFWVGTKGTDRGQIAEYVTGSKRIDRESVRNKIIVEGYDKDGNKMTVTVQDDDSISQYGLREYSYVERNALDIDTLKSLANIILNELKDPKISIPVRLPTPLAVNYNLDSGDLVTIIETRKGLSGTYRIHRITFQESQTTIDLESCPEEISEIIRSVSGIDSTVLPSYTNLPPVAPKDLGVDIATQTLAPNIATQTLGASTEASPGEVVAFRGEDFSTATFSVGTSWTSVSLETKGVPSEEHEVLFVLYQAPYYWTSPGSGVTYAYLRLVIEEPLSGNKTYYPENDATSNQIRIDVDASKSSSDLGYLTVFFTVPKNVSGKYIYVQAKHSWSDHTLVIYHPSLTMWGHSPHTHPASVSPSEHYHAGSSISPSDHYHPGSSISPSSHEHEIVDSQHVNPFTDRRWLRRRRR